MAELFNQAGPPPKVASDKWRPPRTNYMRSMEVSPEINRRVISAMQRGESFSRNMPVTAEMEKAIKAELRKNPRAFMQPM